MMLVWIALLIVWLAATVPDVRAVPLLFASVALVGLLPLVLFPFSKTVRAAIEFLMDGGGPDPVEAE